MILSKGHGCIALYVMLADKGFFPLETLDTFCRRDSILGGHPEAAKVPGVEASTGALGHGLSIGVGMALAARIRKRDSRVIVVMGDGEINEGSVWEAAMCAGKHRLSNLTAVDRLQQAAVRRPDARDPGPRAARRQVARVQLRGRRGRRPRRRGAAHGVLAACRSPTDRPSAIICHTVKGKGIAVRRERRQLAPQVQDRPTTWSPNCTRRWSEPCARPASTWCYELAKRDERVVFIGSDLSPGLLDEHAARRCPSAGTWRASPRRT